MRHNLLKMAILIVILSICLFQSCEKKCPVCPNDDVGEPGNYRLYVINMWSNTLISIETPADTVIDSVSLGYNSYGLYLTPDNNRLLVVNLDTKKIEVYNPSDLSHIETLDQYGDYYFDKTDNIGIYYAGYDEKMFFIDPNTLLPLDSISRGIYGGFLDTVSNQFFAPKLNNPNIVYIINCDTRTLSDSIDMGHSVGNLAYNWLTDEIYFHGTQGQAGGFYSFDIASDSITLTITTTAPSGSISISPNGSIIYMTDGGDGINWIYPRGDIWVISSKTHEAVDLIQPYVFPPGDRITPPLFGDIVITPDNMRAYVASNSSANGYVPLAVIDLYNNKIINGIFLNESFGASEIVLGPVPE